MPGAFSLLGFVAQLHAIDQDLDELGPAIVAKACEMVCEEAKRVIGVGYPEWPELSPATLARKIANTPLLETGELRESIQWESEGLEGQVGSDNDKALWHELGTSRIPPRSFLVGAVHHMQEQILRMAAKAVLAVLRGDGLHGSEMGELIHLLKEAGRAAHEVVKPMTEHRR